MFTFLQFLTIDIFLCHDKAAMIHGVQQFDEQYCHAKTMSPPATALEHKDYDTTDQRGQTFGF